MSSSNDFARFYDLESYLFPTVSAAFAMDKQLSVFDFFCIVTWKANCSKVRIARRLLVRRPGDLQTAVSDLASDVATAKNNKDRMRALIEKWHLRLPTASAILTVLFPEEFTVYDVRVCDLLGDFRDAQNKADFDKLWTRYSDYVAKIRTFPGTSLREKDKNLSGQSFYADLTKDIAGRFRRRVLPTSA
jgi:hypothetical protein